MVKKTVNQDDPTVYHLFYADEDGTPGSDITFFEYPGVQRGRAGAGMIHTVQWRVGSEAALDFWEARLTSASATRDDGALAFEDPEGLRHRLVVSSVADAPLIAEHPEVPAEHALQGFDAVHAFAASPDASSALLENTLEFMSAGEDAWEARGASRGGLYMYDEPPAERGLGGAGTVHHVAWSSSLEEHEAWHTKVTAAGAAPVADHRPLLVPLDLLPRAERRPLRDRDSRPGLLTRRGSRASRGEAHPSARLRAPACSSRAGADTASGPASLGDDRLVDPRSDGVE